MMLRAFHCCGIKELHGISQYDNPTRILEAFCTPGKCSVNNAGEVSYPSFYALPELAKNVPDYSRVAPLRCAFVVFSESSGGKYGEKLAEFIEQNHLGTITSVPTALNVNSGNKLRMYVWTVNFAALNKWKSAHVPDPPVTKPIGQSAQSIGQSIGVPAPGIL